MDEQQGGDAADFGSGIADGCTGALAALGMFLFLSSVILGLTFLSLHSFI